MTGDTIPLPARLDARLVALAATLTAGNAMPAARIVIRSGTPEAQVLEILRTTASAAAREGLSEDDALACCEAAGRVRAAQLASLYALGPRA